MPGDWQRLRLGKGAVSENCCLGGLAGRGQQAGERVEESSPSTGGLPLPAPARASQEREWHAGEV